MLTYKLFYDDLIMSPEDDIPLTILTELVTRPLMSKDLFSRSRSEVDISPWPRLLLLSFSQVTPIWLEILELNAPRLPLLMLECFSFRLHFLLADMILCCRLSSALRA